MGLNPEPSNVNKSPRSLHSKGPSISYKQLSVRTLLPEKMLEAAISPTQSHYGVPGCMHDSERLQGTFAGLPDTSPKVASKSLTVGRHPAHLWKAPPSLTAIEITMPTSAPGAFRSPAAVPHVPNNWQQHTKTRLSKCTDSCSVTAPAQHGKDRTTAKNVISAMPTDAAAASVMRWLQQIQPGPDEHNSRSVQTVYPAVHDVVTALMCDRWWLYESLLLPAQHSPYVHFSLLCLAQPCNDVIKSTASAGPQDG